MTDNNNSPSFKEYTLISQYYGNQKAKRSGVYLINHINEGLQVLDAIKASIVAKKAYCLHPMLQNDFDLQQNYASDWSGIAPHVLLAVMEYRSVANEYLSGRQIASIEEIRLSPLKDVNDMLIADKVQNRKDFMLYHQQSHPRSTQLERYFDNWLERLGVLPPQYQHLVNLL